MFSHTRRIEQCFLLFCVHQQPIVFLSYAWRAPATRHRALCVVVAQITAMRAQTRANAETNCCSVVVVWCREETRWVRCTARRTQASDPTLVFLVWRRRDVPSQLVLVFCILQCD